MQNYNLGFISDEQIFSHVKETVEKYRYHIDLAEFNKNLIDPIKLTFDSKVYKQSIQQTIEAECIQQIDKATCYLVEAIAAKSQDIPNLRRI